MAKYGTPKKKREALRNRGKSSKRRLRKHLRQLIAAGQAPKKSTRSVFRGRVIRGSTFA